VELFNRSEPQATMVFVQPPSGVLPYARTPRALRVQSEAPMQIEAASPVLLPQSPTFPRELEREEVMALTQASGDETRLVVLLLLSGLSLDEALALRRSDVDLDLGLIHVAGESKRDVGIAEHLRPLLASRATAGSPELLLSHQDRPFTTGTVSAQILSAAHDAGIDGVTDVTSDCLRHTYVAFLVRQGIRFADLTQIVGHLPAAVLGAYSALSPSGTLLPRDAINVVYPACAPRSPLG